MWTLASMFYKSVSHPLIAFHFQNSNFFLLSLIPQWFTDWQTHRHNNSTTHTSYHVLPHWCGFKKKKQFFILIHRICTSSTAQAILAINSSQKKKRVRSFPHVPSSLSLIPLVYFCNRSSTLPQTQRKILNTAKLFSTQLFIPLLTSVFFWFPKNCPFPPKTRPSYPSLPPSLAPSRSFSHPPMPNRHSP
jgi:hypothetical protein